MRTDDNKLKENENNIQNNEEEKQVQNKEVKIESNGKLSNLEKFTIFLASTLWTFFCLFLLVFSIFAGLPYDDQEFIEKAPTLLKVKTFLSIITPIMWIVVPFVVITVYIKRKNSKKD
ncbi:MULTISPECIES: hypothetical protein [unclassified Parvimonas]|uniref:hypothetical protein n=1 Tax=unclassified Parvimonas TaxID=1151464 RepID=UPI002B4A9E27|nr:MULTISPECIES: hypothetical protein [unclassified Parvimonas]MEB3024903.1 hypothetical protein [Parvimonas sp. M13]MEB3088952.1 hypothetical protein [Parvimonas sp. M20]